MKTVKTKELPVTLKETELQLGAICANAATSKIEEVIATKYLLDDAIEQLKLRRDALQDFITKKSFDTIKAQLADRGVLDEGEEVEKLVLTLEGKDGTVYKISAVGAIDTGFTVDKELSKKETKDVLPEKYKKTSVTLDKAALEKDFDDGTLPEVLRSYCSKTPTDVIKYVRTTKK